MGVPTGRTGTMTVHIVNCFEGDPGDDAPCRPACIGKAVNLIWLNPQGGWSSYVFEAKRTFQLEQGEPITYKTGGLDLRYGKKQGVYDALIVGTGYVSKDDIDYITTLRYAIQAYEYIEGGFRSIILDNETFDKYRDREGVLPNELPVPVQ